ncbi:hypothetical protein [Streptomyces sp. NPDC058614]|uniref:hypothetical protein n=1 Tax=Streptomyces sp. NPDC058614 TaxID=3346557 RepID=UPI003667FDB9
MTTRDAETLAQLVSAVAGKGKKWTFEQLAARSVDPETNYSPSPNLLWTLAKGAAVKVNPKLVRALVAGLGLPRERVADAAHRQFISGWTSTPAPFNPPEDEDDDVVYRVAAAAGITPEEMPAVERFYNELRRSQSHGQGSDEE